MKPDYLTQSAIDKFVQMALAEDRSYTDHSTLATVSAHQIAKANLLIKGNGILAGVAMAHQIFRARSPEMQITLYKTDGDRVQSGDIAFTIEGSAQALLSAERVALNCLQRMSGIATFTRQLRQKVQATPTCIVDTRKTTPNFRLAEKWAVFIGGGANHRFALHDMILLKDNHVSLAGGVVQAIKKALEFNAQLKPPLKIEIETRTLQEVEDVLSVGMVDRIMLDNMTLSTLREAVKMISHRYETEASGNINENNIEAVAQCGVDYISIGALTHSVKSMDMSLKIIPFQGESS